MVRCGRSVSAQDRSDKSSGLPRPLFGDCNRLFAPRPRVRALARPVAEVVAGRREMTTAPRRRGHMSTCAIGPEGSGRLPPCRTQTVPIVPIFQDTFLIVIVQILNQSNTADKRIPGPAASDRDAGPERRAVAGTRPGPCPASAAARRRRHHAPGHDRSHLPGRSLGARPPGAGVIVRSPREDGSLRAGRPSPPGESPRAGS